MNLKEALAQRRANMELLIRDVEKIIRDEMLKYDELLYERNDLQRQLRNSDFLFNHLLSDYQKLEEELKMLKNGMNGKLSNHLVINWKSIIFAVKFYLYKRQKRKTT